MFTKEKIKLRVKELARLQYTESLPIGPIYAERLEGGSIEGFTISEGQRWGDYDTIYLLNFIVEIPSNWRNRTVALHLNLSAVNSNFSINTVEGLISIDGEPFHAIDRYHREIILTPAQTEKAKLKVSIRLWSGISEQYHTASKMELRCIDPATYQLQQLMGLLLTATDNLTPGTPSYLFLAEALEEACATLDFRRTNEATLYQSAAAVLEKLKQRVSDLNREVLQGNQLSILQPRITGIGHAHIDVAWLWRLRHTRLKAANTFSSALYHMDKYPYFKFIQSQPQLYQFVKEDQPQLYARIKQKVAEGQWEAEGATWVEPDTNVTGAESLVRQFLFGQRFFRQEFGYTSKVLWLPDVFGYSAALPQLIKGAGAEYFITSKISWNDTNRVPADTFWWQGMDGTRVLTYFLTAQNDDGWRAYTYNGDMHPGVLARTWKNYLQKDVNRETLVAYGWGDGGGGPTREMIEAIDFLQQPLSHELPVAKAGKVADFMERLEAKVKGNPNVPDWVGELYLEYHRGTYTSQARTKHNNRLAERDFHTTEWLAALALQLTRQPYPQEELNAEWRKILTNQFHDILPGSSIGEVYQDADLLYQEVQAITRKIQEQAQTSLIQQINTPENSLVVFNGLSWERTGLVEVEASVANNLNLPSQILPAGQSLVEVAEIPSLGYTSFAPISSAVSPKNGLLEVSPQHLENSYYRLELNEKGQITRLYHKEAAREVLPPGTRANVLQLFEDKPLDFDAWDIDAFYEQKSWELDELVSVEVIETGPLRAGLRLEWLYNSRTRITQKLYLYANQPRLDFVTKVDWQERQTLLKVAFPVDVQNSTATADIQFGNIVRPTHRNTSWERAKFETCAHKWFDLSEGDYGVALLNDCKYGYDVHGNIMRLTLLKGAIQPDPNADLGLHHFTYSLLPHTGGWFEGKVHHVAYELNNPLLSVVSFGSKGGTLPSSWSLVQVEARSNSVIIETVKKAEDSNHIIIRLYECANRRGPVKLHFASRIQEAIETNLLEDRVGELEIEADGRSIALTLNPYQIKTLCLKLL